MLGGGPRKTVVQHRAIIVGGYDHPFFFWAEISEEKINQKSSELGPFAHRSRVELRSAFSYVLVQVLNPEGIKSSAEPGLFAPPRAHAKHVSGARIFVVFDAPTFKLGVFDTLTLSLVMIFDARGHPAGPRPPAH